MKLSRIRGDIETVKSRIRKSFRQILHDKDTALYLQDAIITQRNGRYVVPVKEEYRYKLMESFTIVPLPGKHSLWSR